MQRKKKNQMYILSSRKNFSGFGHIRSTIQNFYQDFVTSNYNNISMKMQIFKIVPCRGLNVTDVEEKLGKIIYWDILFSQANQYRQNCIQCHCLWHQGLFQAGTVAQSHILGSQSVCGCLHLMMHPIECCFQFVF